MPVSFDYLDNRTEPSGDVVSLQRFRLIADKIEKDPALLQIPLDNIQRWLANGHSATKRLNEWKEMLLEARSSQVALLRLTYLLRDDSAESTFMREFAPFPGVLTSEELNELSWTSAH